MDIQSDSSDQPFIDTPTLVGEHVRVTLIRSDKAGYGTDVLKLQIREANGHLRRYGPEIPMDAVGDVVKALVELVRRG